MGTSMLDKQATLTSLPQEWREELRPFIAEKVAKSERKIVVLDDDPTGTQTVHDVPVLTGWSVDALQAELADEAASCFYILTNSRSLPEPKAKALNQEIGQNLLEARQLTGKEFVVVSRSDSTLRGHFPAEVDALTEALRTDFDAWLIIPFFLEGGRYTIHDVHYVAEGTNLVPAAQTAFARDKAFGYQHSNLHDWVVEKSNGRFSPTAITAITISDLRQKGPQHITQKLLALPKGSVCIVNAASYRDLDVFVAGLLAAETAGKQYLYRTAASFVRVRAGLAERPLLTAADLFPQQKQGGGLLVAGSYVPKTTQQLACLLESELVTAVEINVSALLKDDTQTDEIQRVAQEADAALQSGADVALFTSRQLITGDDAISSLAIGQRISDSLIDIVRGISTQPRYMLAKGGITSSDVATKGLGIERAMVLGQLLPGVPVWQTGIESQYPQMPYIVFPGNVGGEDALVESVQRLKTYDNL